MKIIHLKMIKNQYLLNKFMDLVLIKTKHKYNGFKMIRIIN